MTTSIMMITYNRLQLTQRMLKNFFHNTESQYRLIIVDNGSNDGTQEWLSDLEKKYTKHTEFCKKIDLLFNKENLGIAKGRNQCLKIADQYNDKWLATLDNDVELPYNWLSECIEIIQVMGNNFIVGVNMEDVVYPQITYAGKIFQLKKQGNLGTACMVFPRKLHDDIGFFTTEYERYGEEDSDFCFRARVAKYQLGYIQESGTHFGVGELDTGEYRKFKDDCRAKNLAKFRQNCGLYANRLKSIFIPYSE